MGTENALPRPRWQLVEVWGDTADTRHLTWAIVLGIGISLPAFLLASRVLTSYVASPDLAKAYAMLAGLGGCILAGVLCAVLFKPKRVVAEGEAADPFWRQEVLAQLAEQTGDLGSVADLPPAVAREMKELGIYKLFLEYEKNHSIAKAVTEDAHQQACVVQPSATAHTQEA